MLHLKLSYHFFWNESSIFTMVQQPGAETLKSKGLQRHQCCVQITTNRDVSCSIVLELIDITCTLLLLNPDFTTAWNVRYVALRGCHQKTWVLHESAERFASSGC